MMINETSTCQASSAIDSWFSDHHAAVKFFDANIAISGNFVLSAQNLIT